MAGKKTQQIINHAFGKSTFLRKVLPSFVPTENPRKLNMETDYLNKGHWIGLGLNAPGKEVDGYWFGRKFLQLHGR